jgi:hypothetical protein
MHQAVFMAVAFFAICGLCAVHAAEAPGRVAPVTMMTAYALEYDEVTVRTGAGGALEPLALHVSATLLVQAPPAKAGTAGALNVTSQDVKVTHGGHADSARAAREMSEYWQRFDMSLPLGAGGQVDRAGMRFTPGNDIEQDLFDCLVPRIRQHLCAPAIPC